MAADDKKSGHQGPNAFAGYSEDAFLLIANLIPAALKNGSYPARRIPPGDPRWAGLNAASGVEGVYDITPTDHHGVDDRARVLVQVQNGAWRSSRPEPTARLPPRVPMRAATSSCCWCRTGDHGRDFVLLALGLLPGVFRHRRDLDPAGRFRRLRHAELCGTVLAHRIPARSGCWIRMALLCGSFFPAPRARRRLAWVQRSARAARRR